MSFSFKVTINPPTKILAAIKFGQFMMDQSVLKDSNYYVPMDESFLAKSALIHSSVGKGRLVWQTPYAKKLYYNPQYNFSEDKNPNAQGLWFEAAKAQNNDRWVKEALKAVKSKLV